MNLPLISVPLGKILETRFGLPVALENDSNAAAVAEHRFGAARGFSHALMLTLGTGVGGGVIVADELLHGADGTGAELGHMTIDANGPPCQGGCQNRGCLETFASGTAVERLALERGLEHIDARTVTELAHGGDACAIEILQEVAVSLGVALASFANLFNPQVVIIGGGFGEAASSLLLPRAADELHRRALRPNRNTPVRRAALGDGAGLVGAAVLAADTRRVAVATGSRKKSHYAMKEVGSNHE